MSELLGARNRSRNFRWQLLTTVSALTVLAAAYGTSESEAADQDADRPTVWIEFGGQLERVNNSQDALNPPFLAHITQANLLSALDVQKPSAYSFGDEGKISIQPEDSNWVFSASVRYGRSNAKRHRHQQTENAVVPVQFTLYGYQYGPKYYYPKSHVRFTDGRTAQSEQHLILDFKAGRDFGLGMFGGRGSSTLSAGVRIAQFNSKTSVALSGEPDLQYPAAPITTFQERVAFKYAPIHFHDYSATINDQRSFRGIGPSLAWDASMPVIGDAERGGMSFDWGANVAVLFGRQKAQGHRQTATRSYYFNHWVKANGINGIGNSIGGYFAGGACGCSHGPFAQRTNGGDFNRARSVIVPNLGGFAGVSFLYSGAKVSFGYRADFFFGAMDGGIDTAKKENRGFYGPFATISVGIGG
jgi:iron complex outermembrane recepter protein